MKNAIVGVLVDDEKTIVRTAPKLLRFWGQHERNLRRWCEQKGFRIEEVKAHGPEEEEL